MLSKVNEKELENHNFRGERVLTEIRKTRQFKFKALYQSIFYKYSSVHDIQTKLWDTATVNLTTKFSSLAKHLGEYGSFIYLASFLSEKACSYIMTFQNLT